LNGKTKGLTTGSLAPDLRTDSVAVKARIDAEHFVVVPGKQRTLVKPLPIRVSADYLEDPPDRQPVASATSREDFLAVPMARKCAPDASSRRSADLDIFGIIVARYYPTWLVAP